MFIISENTKSCKIYGSEIPILVMKISPGVNFLLSLYKRIIHPYLANSKQIDKIGDSIMANQLNLNKVGEKIRNFFKEKLNSMTKNFKIKSQSEGLYIKLIYTTHSIRVLMFISSDCFRVSFQHTRNVWARIKNY